MPGADFIQALSFLEPCLAEAPPCILGLHRRFCGAPLLCYRAFQYFQRKAAVAEQRGKRGQLAEHAVDVLVSGAFPPGAFSCAGIARFYVFCGGERVHHRNPSFFTDEIPELGQQVPQAAGLYFYDISLRGNDICDVIPDFFFRPASFFVQCVQLLYRPVQVGFIQCVYHASLELYIVTAKNSNNSPKKILIGFFFH